MKLSLPKAGGSIQNEALMWGGLAMLGIFTFGMINTQVSGYLSPPAAPVKKAMFAWSEGMPWRDRSVWYQWKSDWAGNDPTKRLTVA